MIRNFRSTTFAAFGVLAACMFSAGPASAQDLFTAQAGTAVATGTSVKTPVSSYTGTGITMDCVPLHYSGTFASGAGELTLLRTYTGAEESGGVCNLGGTSFPLDFKGCGYKLTGKTTQEDGGKTDAVVWIVCPGSAEITTAGPLGCQIKIPAQTPTTGGATYTNEAGGKVRVALTLTGTTYTTTAACALLGFPSEGDTLDLTDSFVLEGFKDLGGSGDKFEEGAQLGIEVS